MVRLPPPANNNNKNVTVLASGIVLEIYSLTIFKFSKALAVSDYALYAN